MRKKVLFVAATMALASLTGDGAVEIRLRPGIPLLFAEDSVIESQTNLVRIIHQGRPDAEPALREGAPWEKDAKGRAHLCVFGSVYPKDDGTGYRMWYNCHARVNYAESVDGVNWTKPLLGVNAIGTAPDAAQNNVVIPWLGSPAVLDDKFEKDPQKRFKLVGSRYGKTKEESKNGLDPENPMRGYYSATSPDGIHWTKPKRFLKHWWDTCTLVQDPFTGEYLFYHKHEVPELGATRRTVYLSRSRDFETWSDPVRVFGADLLDDAMWRTEPEQWTDVYELSVVPHAGGFIGFPAIFRMAEIFKKFDKSKNQCGHNGPGFLAFAASRDGVSWKRDLGRQRILPERPKGEWTHSQWGCTAGGALLHHGEESWLYVYFSKTDHGEGWPDGMTVPTCSIGRAVWRRWGFVSMETWRGGEMTTVPLVLESAKLTVNARPVTNRDPKYGSVTVSVLDANGKTLASGNVTGDGTRLPVAWSKKPPTGVPVRLRFRLSCAALYSVEVE